MRKYIPAVGEEWFPPELLKRIPKATLIPLKMGEICGMAFVTFWVLIIDLIIIGMLLLIVAVFTAAASAVS